jgi:hypothetical protein
LQKLLDCNVTNLRNKEDFIKQGKRFTERAMSEKGDGGIEK